MSKCGYYKTLSKKSLSGEVGGRERIPSGEIKVHYCRHPNHSPFDFGEANAALQTEFAIEQLKCAGDQDQCLLTREELDDI